MSTSRPINQLKNSMRCLVASDDSKRGQHCREIVLRGGLDCPPAQVVSLELAAERASRLAPELTVVVLSGDLEHGLTTVRELRSMLRTQIVVVGPAHDPKFILRTLHDGTDEYLDETIVDQELAEAIIRTKARQAEDQRSAAETGRIISVVAPSGGSGASTLAVNLGAVLAKRQGGCGLIDLRLAAEDLAPLLDLKPTYTLADVCGNLDRMDRAMFERCFVRHASGVQLLAAPRSLDQTSPISSKGIRQVLSLARCRFAYTVLDLDRNFDDAAIEAVRQSETVLLVLRLDYTSLRHARRWCEQMRQRGLNSDRVRLVANRHGEWKQVGVAAAEESLGMKITALIPNDPWRVNRAINMGKPVVLQSPLAKISRRITALAASVNGHAPMAKQRERISS